ncbi:hypothetical protein TNCV_1333681 [Trichonephila clavipes]|nr:hypothetical protein TNCV_1333681 [Trichonephila clavipes]
MASCPTRQISPIEYRQSMIQLSLRMRLLHVRLLSFVIGCGHLLDGQSEASEIAIPEGRNLILPRASKPNGRSMDLYHVIKSYDMASVDFLHHENPSTWAEVEPTALGTEGQ